LYEELRLRREIGDPKHLVAGAPMRAAARFRTPARAPSPWRICIVTHFSV